ncbi:low molecular weight protein-tyrosine-phosphatase [Lachnospira pectinoschiza]|uniref:protein-tyrosine-phosphatase n=1 Tax=Lachnospira pectinoschiza TaxID=28052 RepID=A0A1G9YVZ9_9FIRM|nr:low molecular weight protein-tyrosine-phosphatase [Lachnospira pectinoschiza]SDN12731.1 protein-tyrosine phosphatase [Lachnospira pectinoschiza]
MTKILFICHGNICRSPMAEFILKDMVEKQGRVDEFYIESAATSTEEIWRGVGNPVYPPAREILASHGISCKGKRARQVKYEDYDKFDLLIAMDANNLRNMRKLIPEDTKGKVHLMMEYAGQKRDVADPWYTGNFQKTWDDIYLACGKLLENL